MSAENFGLGIKIWEKSTCRWKWKGWEITLGKCGSWEEGLLQNLRGRICQVSRKGLRGRTKIRNILSCLFQETVSRRKTSDKLFSEAKGDKD